MKLRILDLLTYKSMKASSNDLTPLFINNDYCIEVSSEFTVVENGSDKLICLGNVRAIDGNIQKKQSNKDLLNELLDFNSIEEVQDRVSGRYILLLIKNDIIRIIQDTFARADIYYLLDEKSVVITTDMSLFPVDNTCDEYDQSALAHMLTSYGNRPARKQTIYRSIRRLGVSESITLDKNGFNIKAIKFIPEKIQRYTKSDNEKYCDIFLETLEEEGSKDGNLVYLSSGWDSTSILAGLVHVFGAKKVSVITGKMKYSDRSGICNQIEIDKVDKFSEYYKVNHEIVDFNYADNGLNLVELALPIMKKHGFFSLTAVNHCILAGAAKKTIGDSNQVVFAGEISDGVHNFGFSQYVTKFHPSYGFREYADKMACYLFGPTFLQRIIDGDYEDDPIYKLFYSESGFKVDKAKGTKRDIIKQLLIDFFLRSGRRPFWSSGNIKMLTNTGLDNYTEHHYRDYLTIADQTNTRNLYSSYMHLYNSFHWQSSTVAPLQVMAEEYGLKSSLPFWDKSLQDFLSVMPEEWGRGLDLNSTKYPLKWMLANKLDYPIEYQDGPHSYTYDTDQSFNHYEEILRYSALAGEVASMARNFDFDNMLSDEYFDINYIKELKSRFLAGDKLTSAEYNEISSLYLLAKLG